MNSKCKLCAYIEDKMKRHKKRRQQISKNLQEKNRKETTEIKGKTDTFVVIAEII